MANFTNIVKGTLGALSGGPTTNYQVNPDTGATETTQTPQKPGEMFRSMFHGMLSGLAGGIAANKSGAPGGLAAFAGGAQSVMDQSQQQDLLKRSQAQQTFQDTQEADRMTLDKARNAREQVQSGLDVAKTQASIKEIEANTQNLSDEHSQRALDRLKQSSDAYNALQNIGFAPVKGAPEFDDIPSAMSWGSDHTRSK
jgi:primase-polymerase (primpol)-like protein